MIRRYTLVLHIGMPKTGTGSIQAALATTPDLPFRYPKAGRWPGGMNHNRLGTDLLTGNMEVWQEVEPEIDADTIISSEQLAWLGDMSQLAQLTRVYDCRIIVYLRRPCEFAQSWYKQKVKTGQCTWTYERFVHENEAYFDYPALLRRWESIGSMAVFVYHEQEVVTHFFGQLGLPEPARVEKRNESPTHVGLVRFANMLPGKHKWTVGKRILRLGVPVNFRRGDAVVESVVKSWDRSCLERHLTPRQIDALSS